MSSPFPTHARLREYFDYAYPQEKEETGHMLDVIHAIRTDMAFVLVLLRGA